MRKIVYNISEIEPYINWLYFYHAWGLSGKPREEKEKNEGCKTKRSNPSY